MFATHVDEMHCNRGEGFEREFKVRMCVCVCVYVSVRVCVCVKYESVSECGMVHNPELTLTQCSVVVMCEMAVH